MELDKLNNFRIILASASPRRQELLKGLGLTFEVKVTDVDEKFPPSLRHSEIAVYLSQLKANAFKEVDLCSNCLLITADTIVWQNNRILPKPRDREDAISILNQLSGDVHDVITGVTLKSKEKCTSFFSDTRVFFKELSQAEINHYVDVYKPYDKAGAYGIQEWIGFIGIEKIEGSYYNVMGLPVQQLYSELLRFVQ